MNRTTELLDTSVASHSCTDETILNKEMNQGFQYIELSFINSYEEIKKQIRNTVAISFLMNEGFKETTLDSYLESTQYGFTASANEKGTHRLLRITDIISSDVNWNNVPHCDCNSEEKYLLSKGDILVARTGGTTGKSFLINNAPSNAIFASYLIRLRIKKNNEPEFISLFLNSYAFWSQISELKSGSAQPNVNAEKLKTLIIPECSPKIQNKFIQALNGESEYSNDDFIVSLKRNIDAVVSKLDQLELLKKEFEFQQSYLQQLRQSILQEAVQGKLTNSVAKANTENELIYPPAKAGGNAKNKINSKDENNDLPQDSELPQASACGEKNKQHSSGFSPTESAQQLLERIKAEKQKLIKEGKLKKEKELPPITEDEIPFELPKGWAWCRLGEIITMMDSGWSPACHEYPADQKKWGVLKTTSVQEMYYLENENKELPDGLNPKSQYEVKAGDILITRAGPLNRVGICCLVKETRNKLMISDKIIRFHLFEKFSNFDFVTLCLNAGESKSFIESKKSGMAASQVNISQDNLKLTPIPFAPLSEQNRIMTKVQQLMQMVNQLEQQVQQSQTHAQQLLQAVLKEAFSSKAKVYEENELVTMAAEN